MKFNIIRIELHFAIWNNDKKYWSLEKIRRNMYIKINWQNQCFKNCWSLKILFQISDFKVTFSKTTNASIFLIERGHFCQLIITHLTAELYTFILHSVGSFNLLLNLTEHTSIFPSTSLSSTLANDLSAWMFSSITSIWPIFESLVAFELTWSSVTSGLWTSYCPSTTPCNFPALRTTLSTFSSLKMTSQISSAFGWDTVKINLFGKKFDSLFFELWIQDAPKLFG